MKVYKQSIVDKGHLGALSNLSVLALTKSCEIGRVCSPLTGWTNVMKVLSIFPFSIQQFAWKSWLHGSDISRNVTPNILHILEKRIWKYTAIFWGLTVLWEKARFHFSKKRRGHRSVRLWLFFSFIITDDTSAIFCPSCCFCGSITGPCRSLSHWLVFVWPSRLTSSQLESWFALPLIYLTLCYLAILVTLRVCRMAW